MGIPQPHSPTLLITAAFSRHDAALDWAREKVTDAWGAIALESEVFQFDRTDYYESTMGVGLKKVFWAFETLFDPGKLVEVKYQSDAWEKEYAAASDHPEERPLNLDPGYLTLSKLVLASTKDYAHRIYLDRGMYAEITLYFQGHAWHDHRYTFPDYRREDYQAFFTRCRDYLHQRLRDARGEHAS